MVVAEVCSSMKYPKRCQYKHAKQKKYHVRNWAEYNEGLRREDVKELVETIISDSWSFPALRP